MKSPECGRMYVKGDIEDASDVRSDSEREIEEWEGYDKKKHRLSKSRKTRNGEEAEGSDGSGSRKITGERNESRKRFGGSTRAASDEEDYGTREKSRSKQIRRKEEENILENLSNWYQDGELEINHEGGYKSENRGQNNFSDLERSQRKIKGKDVRSLDAELERTESKNSRYNERTESSKTKVHGSSDQGRNPRGRWDESDMVREAEESSFMENSEPIIGKFSDPKYENTRERSVYAKTEASESKNMAFDPTSNKEERSYDREDRKISSDRGKSKGRSEALEEDNRRSFLTGEDAAEERMGNHIQQRISNDQDNGRSFVEEDGNSWLRDKNRDVERSNRSRTPERSERHHKESEKSDMNYEQSIPFKGKNLERDAHSEDRTRGRVDSRSDRNSDREGSKDIWKRRQRSSHDKETKDDNIVPNHGREWESQKYGWERTDVERPHGRFGGRKDGSRTEAVKTSSKYGISNENYDVIEIQTKPFEYGREMSASSFARRNEVAEQSVMTLAPNSNESAYPPEEGTKKIGIGSGSYGDDIDADFQAGTVRSQQGILNRSASGQSSDGGLQPPYGNQETGSFGRAVPQGGKGGRVGRGWGRPMGRDSQQVGLPLPMMGSPFGPLGMPPSGPIQPLNPNMSPAPVPPVSPSIFIPPFSPIGWPGPRGVEMNMLAVPPGLPPLSSGTPGSRFPPSVGNPPTPALYFNHPGPGRGASPNTSAPGFNASVPMGRGQPQDKTPGPGGWVPRNNGSIAKAPSRGEQNDYSQNFVDTGMRPQNFIRELELTSVVEDYPKLRELIQKKDEIVANSASPPMYYKCDLHELELSPEFFGTKFDVILVDPPWEEYVHRAPGVTDLMDYWTFEEIMNLKIEAIADTPSFIFLWVGDGVGLEQGRQCLKKWGFRRCEDICWVKTNKTNATPGLRHDSHTLFQRSKEHCLMGIKGTVRRSNDGHIIHANIDTDVIIAEEPPYGSTAKPEDMYRIIEHFALGRRRLELFGEDHNIRSGWLTVGKGLSSSNFDAKAYVRNFADKDGKVWQGGGGRNPPPEAPHLVLTTPDIESLRPKSPMKNYQQQQQQQQQQSASISITAANSSGRRPTGNSPQNYNFVNLNQEASSSNPSGLPPWVSPMEGFNPSYMQANADFMDYESHRGMNSL